MTLQQIQQEIYYLQLRLERLQKSVCCTPTGLQTVTTEDSPTVSWSGTGTADDPLVATVLGEGTPANPSALVGLTAINGVATTYMRSDASPALSQSIAPTWTGVHTFNAANTLFAGNINVKGAVSSADNTSPAGVTNTGVSINGGNNFCYVTMFDQTRTVNNRTGELIFINGQLQLRFLNDAHSTAVVPLAVVGGQASGITGITTNSGSGVLAHTGGMSVSSLAGTGTRAVVANATGVLSTQAIPLVFEGAALPGDLTPYPEGSLFIIT